MQHKTQGYFFFKSKISQIWQALGDPEGAVKRTRCYRDGKDFGSSQDAEEDSVQQSEEFPGRSISCQLVVHITDLLPL